MKPRAVLIAALLLVVIVVAIIVGWASVGDRPGPMDSAASYHMTDLGWVSPETTGAYLASPEPWATERADQIYKSLPPSERFVPFSVRATRNRKAAEGRDTDTLF
jgi:hypothetical protein